MTTQLLATIADVLQMQWWADHNRRPSDKPRPIKRPGTEQRTTYGTAPLPLDDMARWLGWPSQN